MNQNEPRLQERARQGDIEAFNVLVELHQAAIYNLCLRLMGAREAAEDATQEAFIAAFRHMNRFQGGNFRAWIYKIAANKCRDELRRKRSRPALSLQAPTVGSAPLDVPANLPTMEEHIERIELSQVLQIALTQIPFEQRLAIVLRDVQGLSYEEIAEATSSSLGTVKSRISRGRDRLRRLLLAQGEHLPRDFRQ